MSIYEFFIMPGAILCTGIIIISLVGLNPKIIKNSKGSIQIGKIDNQSLARMSKEQRKVVCLLLIFATSICALCTALVSFVFIKISSVTLLAFLICAVLQICLFLLIGYPFYRKMCHIIGL